MVVITVQVSAPIPDYWITIAEAPDGTTQYTDAVDIEADVFTPLVLGVCVCSTATGSGAGGAWLLRVSPTEQPP